MFVRRCGMTVLAYRLHWIAAPGEALRRANDPSYLPQQDAYNIWGWVDVRDAARAFRLGLEADLAGFQPINIVASDTLRREPTEELMRALVSETEIRAPIPDNASGWSIERARDLLGWVPVHSWRDEERSE
jgi:nucleoside-diphosphate-sugar epimerase